MRIQARHTKLNAAMKLWRQARVYVPLLLIGLGWTQPIQAQEAHGQVAQLIPAKEAIAVSFESTAEVESAAVTKSMVQRRDYQSFLSQLARPQPLISSFESWQPVPVWLITPNTSQASAGKKNKKAGVLVGMLGLSLAGAGGYLTATSWKSLASVLFLFASTHSDRVCVVRSSGPSGSIKGDSTAESVCRQRE